MWRVAAAPPHVENVIGAVCINSASAPLKQSKGGAEFESSSRRWKLAEAGNAQHFGLDLFREAPAEYDKELNYCQFVGNIIALSARARERVIIAYKYIFRIT